MTNKNAPSNRMSVFVGAVVTAFILFALLIPVPVYGKETIDAIGKIPAQPGWRPTELEVLLMLDSVLGSAEQTIGWDNIYFWIAIDKCTLLCEELAPAYDPNSPERNFIDRSIPELTNISYVFFDKINAGERVNPEGPEAEAAKEKIKELRTEINAMIERAPQNKEPIPQWRGGFIYEKWYEQRKEMLRRWLENTPEEEEG